MCLRTFSLSRILIATFSPVSTFLANFTFAKVPSPRVLPSSYLPTRVLLPLPPLLEDDILWNQSKLLSFPSLSLSKTEVPVLIFYLSRSLLLAWLPYLRLGYTHICFFFFNSTFLKKEKKTKKGNKSIYDGIEKEKIERQKEKS